MTILNKPHFITHAEASLDATPYDVKWIPHTTKWVVIGQQPNGQGSLHLYELHQGKISLVKKVTHEHAFKCGSLQASPRHHHHLATGDFQGNLHIWDLERPNVPIYSTKAHDKIINALDAFGGSASSVQVGPPEIVTGSRDGCVKVWDVRQQDRPVLTINPTSPEEARDCWAVAFGNGFNEEERCITAGYDNGDVKMLDMRNMSLLWETNVKNGVCALEFDRKDINMNKLVVATLESKFLVFDLRTLNKEQGFASLSTTVGSPSENSTIWMVKHLPQNRDVFVASGGNGELNLYQYHYPSKRSRKDPDSQQDVGVMGTVEHLHKSKVAEQPVCALDWNPDKQGLCAFVSFDQHVRIGMATRLASLK